MVAGILQGLLSAVVAAPSAAMAGLGDAIERGADGIPVLGVAGRVLGDTGRAGLNLAGDIRDADLSLGGSSISMRGGSIITSMGSFFGLGQNSEPAVGQVRAQEISAPVQAQTQAVSPFECNMNDVCVPAGLPNLRTGGVGIGSGI